MAYEVRVGACSTGRKNTDDRESDAVQFRIPKKKRGTKRRVDIHVQEYN